MFKWLANLRDSNEKQTKKLQDIVGRINALEPDFQKLTDEELRAKTAEFKARIVESTAGIREELINVGAELDEAKKEQVSAKEGFDKASADAHRKELEERFASLEKERQAVETDFLNELLPEAFAAVREASRRKTGQRHFDTQMMGGIVLHRGEIAEMKTGEGKTLVATLPLYLNALVGEGVHLATVNDYLSRRDPYWMGPIYHALGMTVSSIYPQQANDPDHVPARLYDPTYDSGKDNDQWRHFRPITRKEAYQADITYGTNSEFGFDYLRDNMVVDLNQCVQRPLNFAIVDEADNLLIDEARTPLIISGVRDQTVDPLYASVNEVVSRMKYKTKAHEDLPESSFNQSEAKDEFESDEQYDYIAYEKERRTEPSPRAQEKIARAFGERVEDLFGEDYRREEYNAIGVEDISKKYQNMTVAERQREEKRAKIRAVFSQSMVANALYQRDKHYIVNDKQQVVIVDEFTGRLMIGRRYSEGLHQAIEAKERVDVQQETMTYATVTIQNYFRMFRKLAGMTGTAVTEAEEFHKIYKLEVVVIPTNRPLIRQDLTDQIYKDEETKFRAVVRQVEELHKAGRPVLLGTVSIEKSEHLAEMMQPKGITAKVLNANPKRSVLEAEIVADAGKKGAVTVATNMAGRGVDIVLGGKEPEKDDLPAHDEWQRKHDEVIALGGLYVIGTERHESRRIDNQLRGRSGRQGDPGASRFFVSLDDDIVRRFGGDRIKGIMTWAGMDEDTPIENKLVSRTIENAQVKVEGYNFDMRKHLVDYDDVVNNHRKVIYEERRKVLAGIDLKANIVKMVADEIGAIVESRTSHNPDQDTDFMGILTEANTIFPIPPTATVDALAQMKPNEIERMLVDEATAQYERREQELGEVNARMVERLIMLRTIDNHWIEHLTTMEDVREGIGLQAIAQRDPLVAYKREGSILFDELKANIQREVAHTIYHIQVVREETPKQQESPMAKMAAANTSKVVGKVDGHKVGRNDPCPCGSGKKYKNCHGK